MSEIKCTNLRFNLDKPLQRQAWERLQAMDRQQYKSYSQVVALAIVDYFDRLDRLKDDPYLENREREERFVSQIVTAVENAMTKALPVYLAGCMTGMAKAVPLDPPQAPDSGQMSVDWGFLGG
ncbi:MAG: adenylate cyclase [Clostridiales bacterium]|nr:adenylate cyclase [Clostridiales bacterium]